MIDQSIPSVMKANVASHLDGQHHTENSTCPRCVGPAAAYRAARAIADDVEAIFAVRL